MFDVLGTNRNRRQAPIAITELTLQSLLHNDLPQKPDENGPSYFDDEDGAGGKAGGSRVGQKRARADDSDNDSDNEMDKGDNLFRARQRKRIVETNLG